MKSTLSFLLSEKRHELVNIHYEKNCLYLSYLCIGIVRG